MNYLKLIFTAFLSFLVLLSFKKQEIKQLTPEKQSLLWKIEGNGLKQASYLFGTMHLIEKDYFYFPNSLEKIVKKSSVLVMELGELPNQMEAMKYLVLKEGSFFDYFSPEQTDTILRWAKNNLAMDEKAFRASFSSMKPFVVVQTATQLQFMGKTESYEMTLTEIAKKAKIPSKGLETIGEQMAIFDNLTKEQQAEMVMEGIRSQDETVQMTRKMQGIYKRQQLDSLYYMIQGEGGVISNEQSAFLDQRNKNWISKIKEIILNEKAFIAVGAGHLAGEKGVISLLRKEGYTLTPVTF